MHYKIVVWNSSRREWRILAEGLNREEAVNMWKKLYNNGLNPRIVKKKEA